ncbi:MAG: DUF3577 domain-containing protein [Burkholderiaceae bacterium]|nr:DUF3577 domain-containing protein [Burkholderiaceae bacterium]
MSHVIGGHHVRVVPSQQPVVVLQPARRRRRLSQSRSHREAEEGPGVPGLHRGCPPRCDSDVSYTKFDCRVSGADAQAIVSALENDVAADKAVIIGFRIADIYPEMFTFEKGDRKGQPGVSIKGRLLRIKFAKVNGESIDVPQLARAEERESVPF